LTRIEQSKIWKQAWIERDAGFDKLTWASSKSSECKPYQRGFADATLRRNVSRQQSLWESFDTADELERLVKDNTKTIQDTQEKPWEEGKLDAFDQIIQVGGDLGSPIRVGIPEPSKPCRLANTSSPDSSLQTMFYAWDNLPQRALPADMVRVVAITLRPP